MSLHPPLDPILADQGKCLLFIACKSMLLTQHNIHHLLSRIIKQQLYYF